MHIKVNIKLSDKWKGLPYGIVVSGAIGVGTRQAGTRLTA